MSRRWAWARVVGIGDVAKPLDASSAGSAQLQRRGGSLARLQFHRCATWPASASADSKHRRDSQAGGELRHEPRARHCGERKARPARPAPEATLQPATDRRGDNDGERRAAVPRRRSSSARRKGRAHRSTQGKKGGQREHERHQADREARPVHPGMLSTSTVGTFGPRVHDEPQTRCDGNVTTVSHMSVEGERICSQRSCT